MRNRWRKWSLRATAVLLAIGAATVLLRYAFGSGSDAHVVGRAPLEPAARAVALKFVSQAVGRDHLDQAWTLATPTVRGGLTKREWLTGDISVPALRAPIASVEIAKIVYSRPEAAELVISVVPRTPNRLRIRETLFVMDLKEIGSRWLVDYCQPSSSHSGPAPS